MNICEYVYENIYDDYIIINAIIPENVPELWNTHF